MSHYLITVALILLLMLAWLGVQHIARSVAARHPEFGPAREEGGGCGTGGKCGACGGRCGTAKTSY